MKVELQKQFRDHFHKEADHVFFCPGRVNLIGEHIDYNGGKVLPCAISLGTWVAVSKNKEKQLRFRSLNFPSTADLHLQSSYTKTRKEWFNYPLGVINELLHHGHGISGLDLLYHGNLPIAAGLSSSASIEMVTFFALNQLFGMGVSLTEAALLCKSVENKFIGVNSGIMDQFAVAMGKKDHGILVDCDSLEYEYIPFDTGKYRLVIINSNKKRELADSKYNERFAECGAALKALKSKLDVNNLCDISPASFDLNRQLIGDPVLEKRAAHVVYENARVKDAVNAMQLRDLDTFGKLLYASHDSLKELYEVSGRELDTIVAFCKQFPGCIGARMTGAGFGGCAIALVQSDQIPGFHSQLKTYYREEIGYDPDPFESEIGDGVREV